MDRIALLKVILPPGIFISRGEAKKGLLAHLLRGKSPQNLPLFAQVSLWSKGATLLIFRTVKVS